MRPCPEYIECMNTVLDGEATPAQEAALSDHLARCPACAALYEDLKALRAGSDALIVPAPEHLKADILSRLDAEPSKAVPFPAQAEKKPLRRWRSWAAMAAVFALVIGVGTRQLLPASGSSAPALLSDSTAPRNTELENADAPRAGEGLKQAAPTQEDTVPQTAGQSVLYSGTPADPTRAALELVVERICGESGYTLETDYVMNLHGLAPCCGFRLLDGESVVDEGRVTYTGLSPNEGYLCFARTWEGQSEEEALLYRYAVSTDLSCVLWVGDSFDPESYDRLLEN